MANTRMNDAANASAALIVCMGVSGCGKSTVARAIAGATGLSFFEADDFHSEENKSRMAAGVPLDDAMREPWIASICDAMAEERRDCVLACSALRKAHRDRFRETGRRTLFLFLDGERDLVADWMSEREGHFMPPGLLDSQFDTLEFPLDEPDVARVVLSNDWSGVREKATNLSKAFLTGKKTSL